MQACLVGRLCLASCEEISFKSCLENPSRSCLAIPRYVYQVDKLEVLGAVYIFAYSDQNEVKHGEHASGRASSVREARLNCHELVQV